MCTVIMPFTNVRFRPVAIFTSLSLYINGFIYGLFIFTLRVRIFEKDICRFCPAIAIAFLQPYGQMDNPTLVMSRHLVYFVSMY
jgi:hypothetical protein